MLDALKKSLSSIAPAAEAVGIDRSTHYKWVESDPEYKAAYEDIKERRIDYVETQLHKLIQEGNTAAIIFFLKTIGKKRGYVESQEINVTENIKPSWFTE